MEATLSPTQTTSTARPGGLGRAGLAVYTLVWREIVRFFRQRNRLTGALGQPLLFLVLFGSGLGASFQPAGLPPGTSYLTYFYPGILLLVVLFTAIFSTFGFIEDRRLGFLKGTLAAPLPRWVLVLGKICGGTLLALIQGILFLPVGYVAGIPFDPWALLATLGVLTLSAFALTALGFALAWRTESQQGFHAIMMLLFMPAWLLSGAFFPREGVPAWLGVVMDLNPLSYALTLLRHALYLDPAFAGEHAACWPLSLAVLLATALGLFGCCFWAAGTRTPADAK
jgi:ABC-2 type transport system permease protein